MPVRFISDCFQVGVLFKKPTWCKCSLAIFHSGVRSEAELISEKDGQSVSSLPYEDIEADEARPLTFPGTTAPAARDINVHEGVHNENTRKF